MSWLASHDVALHFHADWLELLWLSLGFAGLVLAFDSLVQASRDRDAVEELPSRSSSNREIELERALADADVAGARWVIGWQLAILLTACVAVLTPPSPVGRTTTAWVTISLLTFAAAVVPLRTLDQRRRRRRILHERRRAPR